MNQLGHESWRPFQTEGGRRRLCKTSPRTPLRGSSFERWALGVAPTWQCACRHSSPRGTVPLPTFPCSRGAYQTRVCARPMRLNGTYRYGHVDRQLVSQRIHFGVVTLMIVVLVRLLAILRMTQLDGLPPTRRTLSRRRTSLSSHANAARGPCHSAVAS